MKKTLSTSIMLWFYVTIILFPVYSLESNIKKIKSFNEVNFKKYTIEDLVLVDVDQTLVQPVDGYLVNEGTVQGDNFRKQLLEEYPDIQPDSWQDIASIMIKDASRPLIEPTIIDKINALQCRDIIVIACTAMNTGKYGILPSMQQWRYEHLWSLGFQGSFNDMIIEFKSFQRKPIFYKGILATDQEKKGPVIGAFLDIMKLEHNRIVMFDDSLEFLESVQEECNKRRIIFEGYQYTAAATTVKKPWNEKLFKFQADYLIKHKKWLSDEEANEYLRES